MKVLRYYICINNIDDRNCINIFSIPVGVKSKQFLPNHTDRRGHLWGGGEGWGVCYCA